MPTNKNAMDRYQILDELLSNRYHNYSLNDITNEVNRRLKETGNKPVTRRCIEKDIYHLEHESQFMVELERYKVIAYNTEKQKEYKKHCIRYSEQGFSIFKKALSSDEEYLLNEVLSLLGQFDGLPNLIALENMRKGLVNKYNRKIISFTKNILENGNLIGRLFTAIAQKQVIEIIYHRFYAPEGICINVHPYLIKEYNHRWFLFAAAEKDAKILCFALDRIDKVTALPSHKYIEYKFDVEEYFDDIIGVTNIVDEPVTRILLWADDSARNYILTKPIHGSQRHYTGEKEIEYRYKYSKLKGGDFFSIDCKCNYELIRELCSFGKSLLVLSPEKIQDLVFERIQNMNNEYAKLRK